MDIWQILMTPFSLLLELFCQVFDSYGIALLLFTVVVKIILFPLQLKGKKSMIKMNVVNAQIQEIQKRCGNDREKYNQEVQKFYAENNVNPMGGCLWSLIPMIVLIALFGGLAGIVAQTRQDRTSTVIPGVAIATALIPPLCTAGFGLATGQIKFFVGAFYLFFINSVFIALATYLMVRFLKYEKNAFIDKVRERNVKRLMMVITLVTFIPSVVIGFHMVRVSLFEAVADKYVAQVFRFPHTRVIECNKHYAHGKDPSQIELLLVGEPIGDEIIENARAQMRNFGLEKAELVVRQANKTDEINVASLQQSYLELLEEKNRRIGEMTAQLKRYRVTNVEVDDISREVGVMMENIKAISLMKGITFDVAGTPLDTTLVCVVTPKAPADSIDRTTLASWLRIRTKVDNVKLFVEP